MANKLEETANQQRGFLELKNNYQYADNEYNETHKNAISDGDEKGKGNGMDVTMTLPNPDDFHISSNGVRSQRMDYSHFPTKETENMTIGGKYDREGNPNIPKSGRLKLMNINTYNENDSYGESSADIDILAERQFFIR